MNEKQVKKIRSKCRDIGVVPSETTYVNTKHNDGRTQRILSSECGRSQYKELKKSHV